MGKFQIGDKVKLRDDLEVGREYGEIVFLSGMEFLKGKELTIDGISKQGNYILEEGYFYYSDEMLEKVIDDSELLKFALDKFNTTKEELIEEYKKDSVDKKIVEDMKKRCKDFGNYCNYRCCDTCDVYKFKKRNNMKELGTRNCMLIYEYLFNK